MKIINSYILRAGTKAALTLAVAAAVLPVRALDAGHFATQSQLSSGHWVKIKVSRTGMQQLSDEQLRQWGFSNPEKVAVYGSGGVVAYEANDFAKPMPDDLSQTPTLRHGNRLIFYGEGADRLYVRSATALNYINNIYDNAGYYFLGETAEPLRIEYTDQAATSSLSAMGEYLHAQIYQPDNCNITTGGVYWTAPELDHNSSRTVEFDFSGYKADSQLSSFANLSYTFVAKNLKAATSLSLSEPSGIEVTYRNNRSAVATEEDVCYYSSPATGSLRFTPAGNGTLPANLAWGFKLAQASNPSYAALKNAWLIYPRTADLRGMPQQPLSYINNISGQKFIMQSDSRLQVWNIANPLGVYAYMTTYDAASGTTTGVSDQRFSPGSDKNRMIAFDPDGQLYQPEWAGEVANQNIHGDPTPEMVIITTAGLQEYAEALAEMHRGRGHTVNVYTHGQVLNEFSSGTNAPIAYRMLAKMFYDRDPERFRYLLLYGPATWDYRGKVEESTGERLLSYLCESSSYMRRLTSNYTSDMYFGLLDDSYDHARIEQSLPSIAVGRINVENPLRAASVNAKIRDYIARPYSPEIFATAITISDSGDAYAHLDQSEDVDARLRQGRPGTTSVKIPLTVHPISREQSPTASRQLHSALYSGAGMFNYSGHGSSALFSSAKIWSINESTTLSYSSLPLAVLSTCNAYEYDHGSNDIASQMLFKSGGGSIASIGACRKVYLMHNGIFNSAIADAYAAAGPGGTVGDVYLDARRRAIANSRGVVSAMVNHMCYNLCGDPMTPLHVPDYRASLSSIGVCPVAEADTGSIAIAVGDRVRLQGCIHDSEGRTISDFNGVVKLILHDGPRQLAAVNRNEQDSPDKCVTVDYDVLATYGAVVTGGRFDTEISVPVPRTPDLANRIIIAAVSEAGGTGQRVTALGESYSMVISSKALPTTDSEVAAPAISTMVTSSAVQGESADFTTGETITVTAAVTAPAGIAGATGLVGAQPRLAVDDNNELDLNRIQIEINADGSYLLQAQLGELMAGQHSATLSLSDNQGHYATRSVSFTIMPSQVRATASVAEQPARRQATIDLECAEAVTGNRLIIEDAAGNTVFSSSDCTFPLSWPLTAADNSPVPDGRYKATVLVKTASGYGATEATPIVVIKEE